MILWIGIKQTEGKEREKACETDIDSETHSVLTQESHKHNNLGTIICVQRIYEVKRYNMYIY